MLTVAFSDFGNVQNVKLVRDKGGAHCFALSYAHSWFAPYLSVGRCCVADQEA